MTEHPTIRTHTMHSCSSAPIVVPNSASPAMPPPGFSWPEGGVTRVPFQVFSDKEIYAMEQEKIFRGPVWHYLCMESEVR